MQHVSEHTRRIRVAVVEDGEDFTSRVRTLMEGGSPAESVDVENTRDVHEGIGLCRARVCDALIIDFSAVEASQGDISSLVRQHAGAVAMIALVDTHEEGTAIRALHCGAQDYLVKNSVDAQMLVHVIRSAIERRQIMSQLETRSREMQTIEAQLLNVVSTSADGMVVVDSQNVVRFANPAAERMLGSDPGSLGGGEFHWLDARSQGGEIVIPRPDGPAVIEVRSVVTEWEGAAAHLYSLRDITVRKKAEEELKRSEERYALAVRGSKDGLWDWNLLNDEVYYSPRWKAILGHTKSEIGNSPSEWFKRVHTDDLETVRTDIAAHLQGHVPHFENEHRLLHKDGTYRWISSRGTTVRSADGKAIRIAGSLSDITERKEAEKNLKRALSDLKFALASEKVLLDELDRRNKELVALSITDGLTGLYNHRFIQERFDFEFKRVKRYDGTLSCMLVDIDHFKRVNDTYGHQFGDLVLREIATILKTQSREVDICGRYGGEEFMIITNQHLEGSLRYATKLHTAIENHIFKSNEHAIHVTVSIGLAEWNRDINTKQELIERADMALYQAKEDGRNLIRVWKEIERRPEEQVLDRGGIVHLKERFDELSSKMRATYVESTHALLRAVDARDHYTEVHSQNVSNYAVELAREMGLADEEVEVIRYAGLLHDIGKIGINQDILVKKDALTEREFDVLRKHPVMGVNILKDVRFLEKELPIILHHHERFDGSGYPQGLKGREIPLGARIMAVVDAFDAMTTDREFKSKRSLQDACEELKAGKGSQFAPDIVDFFLTIIQRHLAQEGNFNHVS